MLILVDDPAVRAHLVAALRAHAQRCRRDAVPLPSSLASLLRFLASDGQARPGLGATDEIADAAGMDVLTLDYRTAADRLGVSERTVRRLVHDGQLPAVRVGTRPRIRTQDLVEFVDQLGTDEGGAAA